VSDESHSTLTPWIVSPAKLVGSAVKDMT